MACHTQRGTRGAGRGRWIRHDTRHRPDPSKPAGSAAHTRPGHCICQGSSGALRNAPAPRLGSLHASSRGSHWRQASSTGLAAPAPRATRNIRGATPWVSACSYGFFALNGAFCSWPGRGERLLRAKFFQGGAGAQNQVQSPAEYRCTLLSSSALSKRDLAAPL